MLDVVKIKEHIVSFLNQTGPTLPIRIAKEVKLEPVYASAILSELLREKRVVTSNLRVGSSPLYFVPGQEKKLEEHLDNITGTAKEALLLLKNHIVLEDESQQPAIRVALRSIKDFAKPFKYQEKIYWQYMFSTDEEVHNKLVPQKVEEPKIEEKPEIKEAPKKVEKPREQKKENPKKELKKFESPAIRAEDQNEFSEEVTKFLSKKEIELSELIQSDKKEIVAKAIVPSKLGKIKYLVVAKNKKTTSPEELKSAFQRSQYERLPCLYIARKELSKKLQESLSEFGSFMFFLSMD